jgi:hypothetical protein
MLPFPNFFPPVGFASSATDLANCLGNVCELPNGKVYRLVKAGAAIAAAEGKILVSAVDGTTGERTWVVDVTTTANDPLVAGVVPEDQVGSTGTTGLVSGDYFLLQVAGDAQVLVVDNTHAGDPLVTTTTAGAGGEMGDETTFLQAELGGCFGVVLKTYSSATTNAAALTAVRLINLR